MEPQQPLCVSDNQSFLLAAVQHKNIHRFRLALLLNGVNPNYVDDTTQMSIFEKCCQTPGYHDFIRECIRWGCDVNKSNELYEKRPINFAVESGDVENIRAILEDPTRLQANNLAQSDETGSQSSNSVDDFTPLHQLATNLNADNFENIFACMKELIDRHANVNSPDRQNRTPLLIIAKKNMPIDQKEAIIKYFLEHSMVDLDTYRNSEARFILKAQFPHLRLPEKNTEKRNWDFIRLITALRDGEESEFLIGLEIVVNAKAPEDEESMQNIFRERFFGETLLMVAAKNGLARAAEKLIRFGADVNNYKPKNVLPKKKQLGDLDDSSNKLKSPLELACVYGNWEVLELLLKCSNIDLGDTPLLVDVVRNIGEPGHTRFCDYKKCFYLLLNFPKIDVNQTDGYGYTALHAAVKYNNQPEILAILDKGAYIGSQNKFTDLPITDIDPNVLENHFNSCVTTNGRRTGDDNYQIIFQYANLVPVSVRRNKTLEDTNTMGKSIKGATLLQCTDEMAPIEYMAKSSELKHLVKHPLIASFLSLKWHQLALVFYTNFVCYTIYCLATICYLLFCYGEESYSKGTAAMLYLATFLGTMYVLTREIAQLMMSPKVYVKNKENWLEMVLIFVTIVVLSNRSFEESTRRTVAAFTILLAVTEFFLLTGSLPVLSFSTHLEMLKTVSKSFMKGLLLYSIILIAFALCFYTLLGGSTILRPGDDVANFNNFVNPAVGIVKAVVMLTGEFDASNINFKHNGASYLLFVVFVFLISTVLCNLLNGLAVSDTQSIKSEAELMNFIYRAKLMARYEKILLGKGENVCCNFFLRKWSSSLMNVFPEFLPLSILCVLPNSNNRVMIPIPSPAQQLAESERSAINIENGNLNYRNLDFAVRALNCCIGLKCSRMEVKIMKYAKHVLDIKGRVLEEQKEKQEMQQRMIKIERRIDDMFAKVELVVETLTKSI